MSGATASILIPCFNAERWIGGAIESALAQTWSKVEVLVADDGSTDGSLDIIRGFDGRISWSSGPRRGGNITRNLLVARSRGEWLQFLDADDYLLPGKIEGQLACAAATPEADVIYGPVYAEWHTADGTTRELVSIPEPADPWVLLARWQLPQTGGPLFRRSALDEVNGWTPDQPVCQEHELYLRLLKAGKRFSYCPTPGAVYRLWSAGTVSVSQRPEQRRRRLEIEQRAAAFLADRDELTPARATAIHDAVFAMARSAWRDGDRDGAHWLLHGLDRMHPRYVPDGETSAYRWVWRVAGFAGAEAVASWRHTLRRYAAAPLRRLRRLTAFARAGGPLAWGGLLQLGWARDNPRSGLVRRRGRITARPRRLRGHAVRVDPRDLAQLVSFEEVFVEGGYPLDRLPFVPATILDCGAHVGFFSVLARRTFPEARLVAFEPDPGNLEALQANLSAFDDCRIVAAAVSTRDGRGRFAAGMGNAGRLADDASGVEVEVVDLAREVGPGGGEALLIKIDIEGEERRLVPHLIPVLPSTCALFVETHHGQPARDEMRAALEQAGFTVTVLRLRDPYADLLALRQGARL